MNHAELVKELVAKHFRVQLSTEKLHVAIDAMQSALDDAVAERDRYMGLWAALSQDAGKAERAIAELEAKLAVRDAEAERLTKALAYQKQRTQQESKRVNLLEEFLKRQGLLVAEFCRPGGLETKTDSWWLLWPVYMVDKTKPPLGYGNTETEAIDAALSEEVKGG